MAYAGNLTCGDCGLTFTSRWGSVSRADEYRCLEDHVLFVEPETKQILALDGMPVDVGTLVELRGVCPLCRTEVSTGLLPACPVCGGRDHEVLLAGEVG